MLEQPIPQVFLFVPATHPERIAKAFAAGADEVIVDWEDSVAPREKAQARMNVAAYCADPAARRIWLRVNSVNSSCFADDLLALTLLPDIKGVILPKAERPADIASLHQSCEKPVIAVIETAKGMLNLPQLAFAEGLHALSYGCIDLSSELGIRLGSLAADAFFNRLRTDLLLHSRLNNLNPPLETVFPDFNDDKGLRNFAAFWHDMGFGGMMCIHPKQVAIVKLLLQPSAETLDFAEKVVSEAERSGAGVFQINGQMVDIPVIERAKRLLGRVS
ncbi:MAG: CoA ester lyase [Neisseria sp.]|nr:CoA ester lyase [Neisseria sp.]